MERACDTQKFEKMNKSWNRFWATPVSVLKYVNIWAIFLHKLK